MQDQIGIFLFADALRAIVILIRECVGQTEIVTTCVTMVSSGVFRPFCICLLDGMCPVEQAYNQLRAKIGIPAHLAEGLLRPELDVAALARELFGVSGRKVAERDSLAVMVHRHDISVFGSVLHIIEVRQSLDGPAKPWMRGYIFDAAPSVPNLATVAQCLDVICPCFDPHK